MKNSVTNIIIGVLAGVILPPLVSAQSEGSKWVWGRSDNTRIVTGEKRYNGELASLSKPLFQPNSNYNEDRRLENLNYRYEVTEPVDNTYRPRPDQGYRPDSINRPVYPYRPPVTPTDTYRPTHRPIGNEYRPLGNGYKPPNENYYLHGLRPGVGTNGKPILTGPTPSWVEDGHSKYRDYDICKCVHSFNCNTPGIKFGTCDEDKQYCCYKSKHGEGHGINERPITNVYERPRPRPVLAGPGGPVDGIVKPYQDKFPSGRPLRPDPELDSDGELNKAYKKGLASAIYELYSRPSNHRYEGDGYRDYDRDYRPSESYKAGSHPSKYGLYYPNGDYGRSANSTIEAISDSKN